MLDPTWQSLTKDRTPGALSSQWFSRLQPAIQKFVTVVSIKPPTSGVQTCNSKSSSPSSLECVQVHSGQCQWLDQQTLWLPLLMGRNHMPLHLKEQLQRQHNSIPVWNEKDQQNYMCQRLLFSLFSNF